MLSVQLRWAMRRPQSVGRTTGNGITLFFFISNHAWECRRAKLKPFVMKRLFLFICVAFIAVATKAQTSLLATLSHNGEISTFYSSKALSEAHKAAQDGDVITLSGGMFDPITVTKNVTIRGAGMAGTNPTIISGTMKVQQASATGTITLEGLYFTTELNAENGANNLNLVKCKIRSFRASTDHIDHTNFKAIHCDFFGYFSGTAKGATIVSSYIYGNVPQYATLVNCVLRGSMSGVAGSYFTNCILEDTSSYTQELGTSNVAQGCFFIGKGDFFKYMTNDTNKVFPVGTNFLKEGTTTYELLDELKTTWLGTDGTQVGMHGGNLPFDPETTVPKIKKFEVSSKTSADGKLSIGLEIDAD